VPDADIRAQAEAAATGGGGGPRMHVNEFPDRWAKIEDTEAAAEAVREAAAAAGFGAPGGPGTGWARWSGPEGERAEPDRFAGKGAAAEAARSGAYRQRRERAAEEGGAAWRAEAAAAEASRRSAQAEAAAREVERRREQEEYELEVAIGALHAACNAR